MRNYAKGSEQANKKITSNFSTHHQRHRCRCDWPSGRIFAAGRIACRGASGLIKVICFDEANACAAINAGDNSGIGTGRKVEHDG